MPSSQVDPALINGHDDPSIPAPPGKKAANAKAKKGGTKSTSDEATRLLQARISQLEQDAAGEKDQELEIGECLHPTWFLFGHCQAEGDVSYLTLFWESRARSQTSQPRSRPEHLKNGRDAKD